MRYRFNQPIIASKPTNRLMLLVAAMALIAGLYMLALLLRPALPVGMQRVEAIKHTVQTIKPQAEENRIYIPGMGVNEPITSPSEGGLAQALGDGIAHLEPSNGNPVEGGNFVLAGHRFELGITPGKTYVKSPLYHIDNLEIGEAIYVDYGGVRYFYKVTEKKKVDPSNTSIEDPTDKPRLTLYTCQLSGPQTDRIVVFADPVGKADWVNGKPELKAL